MTLRAYLDVEHSLTGRRWIGPSPEAARLAEAMQQLTLLHPGLCQTLVARDVAPADAKAYLAPSLRDLLPDPLRLRDMSLTRFAIGVRGKIEPLGSGFGFPG